jgi:hypothetical protein
MMTGGSGFISYNSAFDLGANSLQATPAGFCAEFSLYNYFLGWCDNVPAGVSGQPVAGIGETSNVGYSENTNLWGNEQAFGEDPHVNSWPVAQSSGCLVEGWSNGLDGWTSSNQCVNSGGGGTNSIVSNPDYLLNSANSMDIQNTGGTTVGCTTKSISVSNGEIFNFATSGADQGPPNSPSCLWSGTSCADTLSYLRSVQSGGITWYLWSMTATSSGTFTMYLYNNDPSTPTTPTDSYFSVIVEDSPYWSNLPMGGALTFSGVYPNGEYIDEPNAITLGSSITLSVWANATSWNNAVLGTNYNQGIMIGVDSGHLDVVECTGSCGSAPTEINLGGSISSNSLVFLSVTYNGTDYCGYVNGTETSCVAGSAYNTGTQPLWMGGNSFGGYIQGTMASPLVTNQAFTSGQIQSLFESYLQTHVNPLGIDGNNGYSSGSTTVTSGSATLTTTDNEDVIMAIVVGATSTTYSVSDGSGLTWNQRKCMSTSSYEICEFYTMAPNALSSDKITASASAATKLRLEVFGVSGASTTSPFDSLSGIPATNSGSGTSPSVSISTANPNDMIIGVFVGNGSPTITIGSGFSAIVNSRGNTPFLSAEYQIVTSPQTNLSVSQTYNTNQNWAVIADAIQA